MPLLVRDRVLLQAYRAGERWAFEEVYAFYGPRLRRFLQRGFVFESRGQVLRYRGQGCDADVEWVVQETFARAFEDHMRQAYDGVRPFTRYLQTVARNLVLRELNRTKRLAELDEAVGSGGEERSGLYELRQPQQSPESVAERSELERLLASFLAQLDPEESAFVRHRFIEMRTQEATARAMGTTRARVKTLEARLRRRFLDMFRANGYFAERAPRPRWTRKAKLQAAG